MPKTIGGLVLYSVEDLAKELDMSPRTVRLMLNDGRLKGRKLGGRWYVSEGQLRDFFSISEQEAGVLPSKAGPRDSRRRA